MRVEAMSPLALTNTSVQSDMNYCFCNLLLRYAEARRALNRLSCAAGSSRILVFYMGGATTEAILAPVASSQNSLQNSTITFVQRRPYSKWVPLLVHGELISYLVCGRNYQ